MAGGLVCYEHKFAYSHHETDPSSRQLCNAFDLCRIHLYGVKDEGSRVTDITRKPSFAAMQEMAAADKSVKLLMARERSASMLDDFDSVELPEDYTDEWKADLEYTKSGKLLCSIQNIIQVLENDPALKGRITHDEFTGYDVITGGLPWNRQATQWSDRDDANLRVWLERNYDITGKDKIYDALAAILTRHSYHPIRDYLNGLHWDGTPRLERLIIDYIGAEDTELNRTMTRKHFTAAVARIFQPGCKYDYCLIITGPEGAGKSTLLGKMGGKWFNDSITTTEGKEGMEQLRGAWIIEMGELASIKRSDVESVKAYLSKRNDSYRAGETLWPALSAAHADAAFVADDELATGVLNGAVDAGAQIPAEFEVITGNDSKLTQIVRPKLSSITQPLYDIGAVAMRCLTKMMNKEDEDLDKTIELQYGFIKRGSTR
ncbi:VapE domain-containing protein [Ligilactobacillus aviarius]|uniref:VapE domain-containing protein n=1 Tax=Ligilactobacillus aviarius TaxID=1606 RepID=UPI003D9A65AB